MNLWTKKTGSDGNGGDTAVATAPANQSVAAFASRAAPLSPPVTHWSPPAPRPAQTGGNVNIQAINDAVAQTSGWVRPLQQEMSRVIVGQQYLIDRLMVGLVANGHLLLEGVPGLAKTLSLKTLAAAAQVKFQRLQFTPDMLPADIVGTMIYNPRDGSFHTKHGPVFSNLVLADEINRAPAKVQSALLEAMQERQVTLGDETYKLPDPFLVMATQNPLEHEGTYPLPEAQVDRFMLKVIVDYPNRTEERAILDTMATTEPTLDVTPVVTGEDIIRARRVVNTIYVDDKLKDYIVDIVLATRDPKAHGVDLNGYIQNGASPRATIYLTLAARASAFLQGRGYVTPQDVKNLALDVLRHRVMVSYEAEAENISAEDIIQKIFGNVARAVMAQCWEGMKDMNPDQAREILKKVRQIEIRTNRLVNDSLAGDYHSVFRGRGMDFDEVREYVPGDEVRTIDWNVTARAGRPFVKKFTEERELTILLLVDLSASGNFGSARQSKRELAAELASVLAFSAIRNSDKVGLILFTDQVEQFIPAKKGRRHVLRVIREILYFQPQRRGTNVAQALDFANSVTSRRAVVFLISDFQSSGNQDTALATLRRAMRQTHRRHDLVAVRIQDPHEVTLPSVGILAMEDAETGELIELDTLNPQVRERFQQQALERITKLRRAFNGEAIDSLELVTGEPYVPALKRFFETRERRQR